MAALRKRLGAALREVRKGVGISGAEVARRLGKNQSYVSEWELGRKLVSLDDIADYERALGVPLGTVLTRAGFVEQGSDAVAALAVDQSLSDSQRRTILSVYRDMVSRAQGKGGDVPDGV